MPYQVLARKWRPQQLSDVVGQPATLQTLINALTQQRLHHAYLFTGTRGVGKTTIARIFAKCLNCEKGISATPCGVCQSCVELQEGRFIDLIEVDAASRTRAEDTRELLDNVQYAPTRGRYKVYLIDEVHMLSNHSFNALLKTLEEPPSHVIFLLATTDPQKLPVTVLSRCLQFHLKHLSVDSIAQQLAFILKQENIPYEDDALALIAEAAKGSMRDALSVLDQAIAYGNRAIHTADISQLLGLVHQQDLIPFVEALAAKDGEALLALSQEAALSGLDLQQVLANLLHVFHQLSVMQIVPAGLKGRTVNHQALESLAQRLSPQDLQLFYQIGLIGQRDLPFAPNEKIGFEMALLRMLAFQPQQGMAVASPLSNVSSSEPRELSSQSQVKDLSSQPQNLSSQPQDLSSPRRRGPIPTPAPEPSEQWVPAYAGMTDQRAGTTEQEAKINDEKTATNEPLPKDAAPLSSSLTEWEQILAQLQLKGLSQVLASHCVLDRMEDQTVYFLVNANQSALINAKQQSVLSEALSRYFGRDIKAIMTASEGTLSNTPAALSQERADQQQKAAESSLMQDPNMRALMEQFGAVIEPDSIEPR
jgi:DNA polymerase-3 subunit gamma/tau